MGGCSSAQLLQAQDVVDALYQANDDRLPGYQVSKPVQQLPVHDVRPLPAGSMLTKRGGVRAAKAGPGDRPQGLPMSSRELPTLSSYSTESAYKERQLLSRKPHPVFPCWNKGLKRMREMKTEGTSEEDRGRGVKLSSP